MLPYKRLTYLSDLSAEQISTKLKDITQEKGTGKSGFQENKYFEGSIIENRFKLNHASDKYFNPVIVGCIQTMPSYTKIEMQLKPSRSIISFLFFILVFLLIEYW